MYQTLAHDYDRFVNWQNRLSYEMPFLLKQIASLQQSSGEPIEILDAACGTAMHAVALAKLSHRVSAADISPEMIGMSRRNADAAGVDIHLEAVGFGSLAKTFGKGKFDLILCLGNSLPHLLTPDDLLNALVDFAAVLRSGGMLLIQNRNFDVVMEKRERWMEPQTHSEGTSEWVFQRFYDFEPDGLIRFTIVTLKRETGQDWQASLSSTSLVPQKQALLVSSLSAAGFTGVRSYGGLGGEAFDPLASGNLVLTALKA